ncbi:MAG: OmpA family protein [Nitrospinae bacterium]|nr:OmpA family protein [Nitrospinota bacterium]
MARKITKLDLQKAQAEGESENDWIITFADMVTLLLTFFVLLFAVTSSETEKYAGMLQKVGDAFGGKSLIERKSSDQPPAVEKEIEKALEENNLIRQVHVTSDSRGTVLWAEGDLFFDAGSATVKPQIRRFLDHVARIVEKNGNKVIVEGHTDDVPIATEKFPSNWELSASRASAVVRYFVEEKKMNPRRFVASGYGSTKPRYALIPENRSQNRRVEIIITREKM